MCKQIKEFFKLKTQLDSETKEKIEDINKTKNLFIKKLDEQTANDIRNMENISRAISAAIDERDFEAAKAKLNSMAEILRQSNVEKIKQEILDSRLRSANL